MKIIRMEDDKLLNSINNTIPAIMSLQFTCTKLKIIKVRLQGRI